MFRRLFASAAVPDALKHGFAGAELPPHKFDPQALQEAINSMNDVTTT